MSWYKQGTINVTNGSSTVTGVGTKWVQNLRVGDGLQAPDGKLYEVTNIASDTTLSICPVYGGETLTGQDYWSIPVQGYIKSLADRAAQAMNEMDQEVSKVGGLVNFSDYISSGIERVEGIGEAVLTISGMHRAFANKEVMDADLSAGPGDISIVLNDPDTTQNGWYYKMGISGTGRWQRMINQPANSNRLDFVNLAEDWDALTVSGGYMGPTTGEANGQPERGQMVVEHMEGIAGRAWQRAMPTTNTSPRMFMRSRVAGTWSQWVESSSGGGSPWEPDRLSAGDGSNLYPDPNFLDPSLLEGTFSLRSTNIGSVEENRMSDNYLFIPITTEAFVFPLPLFQVEKGKPYSVSATLGRATGIGSVTTTLLIRWYSDREGEILIREDAIEGVRVSSKPEPLSDTILAPHDAVRARLVIKKDESPNPMSIAFYNVFVRRASTKEITYTPPYSDPVVSASSVIGYFPSGEGTTLFQKNSDIQIPPASLTKIMTACVALDIAESENLGLDFELQLEQEDVVSGSGSNIVVGERLSLHSCLVNMFLPSSNITAMMVARVMGGFLSGGGPSYGKFINSMNSLAQSLGMSKTIFKNASGLPESGQVTTARDIALLMGYASLKPEILDIWGERSSVIEVKSESGSVRLLEVSHTVPLVGARVSGAKSGTITPNNFHVGCYVKAPLGNNVIVVILNASSRDNRYVDAISVIDSLVEGYDWPAPLVPTRRS